MKGKPPERAVRTAADRAALEAGYYWDYEEAERVVRFAESYISPKFTAGEFQLFEWQRRFVQSLYGWRRPDGGRRFMIAVLHVPKKNGKTLIVSVIAAYELFAAAVASPLVVSASTTKENAKQVYEQLAAATDRSAKLTKAARRVDYKRTIYIPKRDAEYRALSADAPSSEGLNCSLVIVDEAHAHKSQKLFRTLEYGMIGRESGLMVVISTAGDDLTHFYYGLVERGRRIIAGTDLDPTCYAEIYEAQPERESLEDPAVWRRVNPSLDLYPGFTSERFGLMLQSAKKNTGDWLSFQRYRLNVFQRPEDAGWIGLETWDQCRGYVPDSVLQACPCWLGFDASQTIDPTSVSAVWLLPEKRYFVRSWSWVAEAGIREREKGNLPKFQQYIAEGSMTMTSGNLIDKAAVKAHILGLAAAYDVKALVMDPNGAWVFGAELASEGIEVFRMPQNFKHFHDPTTSFEESVISGKVVHDGNGWLRYCINNVRLDTDSYKNVRPAKGKSRDHIDGAIAALMAYALANKASAEIRPQASIYEERGFRTL